MGFLCGRSRKGGWRAACLVDADGPEPDRQIRAEIAQTLDVQVIPSIRGERFGGVWEDAAVTPRGILRVC